MNFIHGPAPDLSGDLTVCISGFFILKTVPKFCLSCKLVIQSDIMQALRTVISIKPMSQCNKLEKLSF